MTFKCVSRDGFTVVELLVVVAVIGLLSSLAIPMYNSYQAKIRQAEARSALASMFTAEHGFFMDQSHYTACLGSVGFDMSGASRFYTLGLKNGFLGWNNDGTTPGCTTLCGTHLNFKRLPNSTTCGDTEGQTYFSATDSAGPGSNVTRANLPNGTYIFASTFRIFDMGNIGFSASDYWSLEEDKSITNIGVETCSGGANYPVGECP